jgi:hypothetical protein
MVAFVLVVSATGYGTGRVPSLRVAIWRVLSQLYRGSPLPPLPVSKKHLSFDERNRQICIRYEAGDTLEEFACDYALSHQRVHQIIQRWH